MPDHRVEVGGEGVQRPSGFVQRLLNVPTRDKITLFSIGLFGGTISGFMGYVLSSNYVNEDSQYRYLSGSLGGAAMSTSCFVYTRAGHVFDGDDRSRHFFDFGVTVGSKVGIILGNYTNIVFAGRESQGSSVSR